MITPKPGHLIDVLDGICQRELPGLLADPTTPWKTLHVTYETPTVERVWIQLGEYRLLLHRIHPCNRPLRHPHPWPSAVRILSGQYKMGVGKLGQDGDSEIATMVLTADSKYEMLHPHGWHYVQPLYQPSLSVMLTGVPFPKDPTIKHPGTGENAGLSDDQKVDVLRAFKQFFQCA